MRAERDELEAARLRQVAAAEAQQRHLQEQADELRAVLEVRCSDVDSVILKSVFFRFWSSKLCDSHSLLTLLCHYVFLHYESI